MSRFRVFNTSLPSHGAGALHSYFLSFNGSRWGKGIRVSKGGYTLHNRWHRLFFIRYSGTATHLGWGPFCLSLVFPTRIPGRLGEWLWNRFQIA